MHYRFNPIVLIFVIVVLAISAFAQKSKSKSKPAKTPAPTIVASNAKINPVVKGTTCTGSNGLKAEEIDALLAAQNKIRADLKLSPFTWDCKLADLAQEWATRGVFEHREDVEYGENMFAASNIAVNATAAVDWWMKEKAFWDNTAGACQAGKVCTHYTQMVWKSTAQVGCGINRNASGKYKVILVCNFNPQGNQPGSAY